MSVAPAGLTRLFIRKLDQLDAAARRPMAHLHGRGVSPRWSATAPELLSIGQATIMAAAYAVGGDSFRANAPQIWSPTSIQGACGAWGAYLAPVKLD